MFRNDGPRADKLAEILKRARKKQKLSQEQLAQKVNVSTETIRKIEQKHTDSPGVFLVADLARVLGLQIQKIVSSRRIV